MAAATPELPFAPWPTGQSTALSAPTWLFHVGLASERNVVNTDVVPDSSERCTIVMAVDGRFTPGFSVLIAASFHVLILPRKMSAMVVPSSFSPFDTPFTLYR